MLPLAWGGGFCIIGALKLIAACMLEGALASSWIIDAILYAAPNNIFVDWLMGPICNLLARTAPVLAQKGPKRTPQAEVLTEVFHMHFHKWTVPRKHSSTQTPTWFVQHMFPAKFPHESSQTGVARQTEFPLVMFP